MFLADILPTNEECEEHHGGERYDEDTCVWCELRQLQERSSRLFAAACSIGVALGMVVPEYVVAPSFGKRAVEGIERLQTRMAMLREENVALMKINSGLIESNNTLREIANDLKDVVPSGDGGHSA